MSEFDKGGPDLISGADRGPLCYGERKALEMQAKNMRLGGGNLPEDDERIRNRAIADDPGGLKRPRLVNDPRPYFERHPIKPSEAY